jgi:hypothetical protein
MTHEPKDQADAQDSASAQQPVTYPPTELTWDEREALCTWDDLEPHEVT